MKLFYLKKKKDLKFKQKLSNYKQIKLKKKFTIENYIDFYEMFYQRFVVFLSITLIRNIKQFKTEKTTFIFKYFLAKG